jgi:membrane associated rhomboid family serine protease
MMAPPPPPTVLPAGSLTRADVDMQAGRGGFMDLLFPGFDTSALIWKISLLQMLEYFGSYLMGSAAGAPKLCSLYLLGASWGPSIANGAIWRLFLPIMLHANALHIFFNMFFQMRIGFQMEKQFGKRKFCLLYIFCGFLGNLLSVAYDPMKLAVGASTSGFGLLGVWLAEVMLTWELLGTSRPRIFLWFAFMVLSCVMMSTISPNVDFMGHLGGALAGWLMAVILADMQPEHQPAWYSKVKTAAKNCAALLILAALFKIVVMGPEGPVPFCGNILHPRILPF